MPGAEACDGPVSPPEPSRAAQLVCALCLLALVAVSTLARVETALDDPNFSRVEAEGMLKSDPALLYYFTERILEAGGGLPSDFSRDARVQHPRLTDIPAEFTVGQEFLVAWGFRMYRALGGVGPLHVFALQLMSFVAALVLVCVFACVFWRTRHLGWALGAACLCAVLPANYRTIGFILIREDLSFPLFALHIALLARAARTHGPAAFLAAGLAAGAALATWHAMGFFLVLELAALHLWFLVGKVSPFEVRGSWAVMIGPVLAAMLVPALASNGVLLGLPMQLAWALLGIGWLRRRHDVGRGAALAAGAFVWLSLAILVNWLDPGRTGYAHVYEVLLAKLEHGGVRPLDPREIPFAARLLWQGPFETMSLTALGAWLGSALVLVPVMLLGLLRARRNLPGFELWLLAFGLLAIPTAWIIGRTVILLGCLLPLWTIYLARARRQVPVGLLFLSVLAWQASSFVSVLSAWSQPWYRPPERQQEIAHLVRWVEEHIDSSEPLVADFMNSTAILAHTGNPIVLQPKYETEDSRGRAQAFLETFFSGTPVELQALVRGRFRSNLLLVDRYTLGTLSPWTAGIVGTPRIGTAADLFLSTDAAILGGVPGFELLYRSPTSIHTASGEPSDYFRLYRVR